MRVYTIFLLLMVTWYGVDGRYIEHRRVKRAKVKNTTQNGDTTADGDTKAAKSKTKLTDGEVMSLLLTPIASPSNAESEQQNGAKKSSLDDEDAGDEPKAKTTEDEKAKGLSAIVVIGNRTHRVSGPVVKELLFELQHQQEEEKPKSSDAISRDTSAGSSSDPSSTNSMPYFNLRRLYAANEVAEINKLLGKPLTDAKALGLIKNLLLDKVHTHLAKTMDQNGQSDTPAVVQSDPMPHMPLSAISPTASLRLIQEDTGAITASNIHDREELASPNEVTCHDSDPVDKCQYLKDIGLCGEAEKHPGVRRRCQKTCGLCDWTCDDTDCHPPSSLKEAPCKEAMCVKEPVCKEPTCAKEEPCKEPQCHKPTQHIVGCHPDKDASCLIIVQEQHDHGHDCKEPPCYVVHEAQDVHEAPCKEKGTCVLEEHDLCKEHPCVIQLHPHLTTPLPVIHHTSFKATESTASCAIMGSTFRPDICPASRYATPTQLAVLDAGSTIHPLLTNLPSHPTSPPESIGLLDHEHHDLVIHPTLHPTLLHPTLRPSGHPSWHPSIHPVLHDAELHPGQVRIALRQPLNPTPPRPSMHVVMHDSLHQTLKPSLRPTIDLHHDVLHPSAPQAVILHPTLRPTLRPGLIHPTLQPTLHPPTLRPTAHLDLHPLAVEPAEPPGTTGALISPTGICELPLEIAIAIDTSAAIVPHWQQMLYFVKSLVDRFEMGGVSRIGVITFDTIGKIPIPLDHYRDPESLKVHLDKLFADPYGRRRTDSALEVARSPFFERGRPGIPKVLFLVEHGRINGGDPSINWEDLLLEPAEKLREIGVNVFAVGATPVVTPEELKILTGDWSHVVPLQSYGQLQGIVPQLAIKACKLAGIVRRSKSRSLH